MKKLNLKYNDFINIYWCHAQPPTVEEINTKFNETLSELKDDDNPMYISPNERKSLVLAFEEARPILESGEFEMYFDFRSPNGEFELNYGKYQVSNNKVKTTILYHND